MDASLKEKDKEKIKPENIDDIFCNKCLRIPEYRIIIDKNKTLKLVHSCTNKENSKIDFPISLNNNLNYKCNYCGKNCFNICLECKKYICDECQFEHIPQENKEETIPVIINKKKNEKKEEIYICNKNEIQFICNKHFFEFQYFCPICEENLCFHCKNCHVHINCVSLFEFKEIKNITIISPNTSDEIFINNLIKLCEIFKYSYFQYLNNNKMSLDIIKNYGLIKEVNNFIKNYRNKPLIKGEKIISNKLLQDKNEYRYLCKYFNSDKFVKEYSFLINEVNIGNYEYHHNLSVIKEYYENNHLIIKNYDDNYFFHSLKGKIYNLQYKFHCITENINKINNQIKINFFYKEIEELKLLIDTFDVDIHLLKIINMNLLYKNNYKLRRKVGNLLTEMILSNYSQQIEIKQNNYILLQSIILVQKKIEESKKLEGPKEVLEDYKNNLKKIYETLLKLSSEQILSQLEKIQKGELEFDENDMDVEIQINSKNENDLNDVVLLNLFLVLKKKYGIVFNDSIHNKTDIVNLQIMDEIKKNKYNNTFSDETQSDKKKLENAKKVFDSNSININKECSVHFGMLKELKNYFCIKENSLLKENKYIFNENSQNQPEKKIDDFKSELNDMFKDYEFCESINFKNAFNLYFKGEIIDILSEKKRYENLTKLKNEIENIDIKRAKKDILSNIEKIEPLIDFNLIKIKSIKVDLFDNIRKISRFITIKDKNNKLENPFETLNNLDTINLDKFKGDDISNIYILYLVNLYFCVEQTIEYFDTLKENYKDIKLINDLERNIEKKVLLKIFDSKIKYEEPNTLKEIWNILKKEKTLVQNEFLNEKMKKYVEMNDCDEFLDKLSSIIKLKDNKIELSQSDPQNLQTKAFLCSKGIPLKFPDSLKIK